MKRIQPTGSASVKLSHRQIAWLADHGPFPFVCNQGFIHWPNHTTQQVIDAMGGKPGVPAMIAGLLQPHVHEAVKP